MKISFLKALRGDCIHIESDGHHVIIDVGLKESNAFANIVRELREKNARIDLLVISHYDSDHIGGMLDNNINIWNMVEQIWFNAPESALEKDMKNNRLSLTMGKELQEILKSRNIKWRQDLIPNTAFRICKNWSLKVLYGGKKTKPSLRGEMMSQVKSDWNAQFSELVKYLDDMAVDTSHVNASSIVLLLTDGKRKILLPGDSTPAVLSKALDDYRQNDIIDFDLIKLPHHGSYKNITKELLSKFRCADYVISTDGRTYMHPNKKMLLKIFKWGESKEGIKWKFHFNYYDELFGKLNITQENMDTYNFDCDGQSTFEF